MARSQLLELDDNTRFWLGELAGKLLPHRQRLREVWQATYEQPAIEYSHTDEDGGDVIADLLDLFFTFVPRADYEGYYDAIIAKGKEYQARELSYGNLMLAVHHFEQAVLPFLPEIYSRQRDHDAAIVALDRLSDNAIVLIASSYFDTTLAEITALQHVTDTALSTLNLDELLRNLLRRTVEAIRGDAGAITLFNDAGELAARCYVGLSSSARLAQPESEDSLGNEVARTGEARQIVVTEGDKQGIDENLRLAGVRTVACMPLKQGARTLGVVHVGRKQVGRFARREMRLLDLLAERAVAAVDHAELYERTSRLLRQTAALQRITNCISAQTAPRQVLEVVIDAAVEVFGANHVAIHLRDRDGNWTCAASRSLSPAFVEAVGGSLLDRLLGEPIGASGHIYNTDIRHEPGLESVRHALLNDGIRTLLILPFGRHAEGSGILSLFHDNVRRYDDEERRLAQAFADQTAIAIANANLYQEIREHAAESERLSNELQALDKMKADFLAMVSHELRTPLTAILGYADLLLRGARGTMSDRQGNDLKTIRTNGHRLLTLINDLIDFSSIEAGHTTLKTVPLQLGQFVPALLQQFKSLAESRAISLRSELQSDLPPVTADPTALEKILRQLLSNAIKFTPAGGRVALRGSTEANQVANSGEAVVPDACTMPPTKVRYVVLSVVDNGIGIPAEQLSRIWDHFYQIDSSSARRFGGTGLGLAIVKRLVEAQGGQIWATSEGVAGKGSTFGFTVPVA